MLQYTPQPNVAGWLSSHERMQAPKNGTLLLQSIRDGTLIWRILTLHLSDAPPPASSITERWKQIALALIDCGVEMTPFGLKLILLGDAPAIDKLLSVLFSLHHAGGQGTSVVAGLITPLTPEPELVFPRLFYSTLVNARHNNFVPRVKVLTEGCCTPDTSSDEKELLQLEALSTHSKRLVEFGLSHEFFRLAVALILRRKSDTLALKVAAQLKAFVREVGPDTTLGCLFSPPSPSTSSHNAVSTLAGTSSTSIPMATPVNASFQTPVTVARDSGYYNTNDGSNGLPDSPMILDDIGTVIQSSEALPEIVEFFVLLLVDVCEKRDLSGAGALEPPAAPPLQQQRASGKGGNAISLPLHLLSRPGGTLRVFLERLYPANGMGHRAALEGIWCFLSRILNRDVIRPCVPWLTTLAVAILEGRDPDQESFGRFNPNGRFEEDFEEASLASLTATATAVATIPKSVRQPQPAGRPSPSLVEVLRGAKSPRVNGELLPDDGISEAAGGASVTSIGAAGGAHVHRMVLSLLLGTHEGGSSNDTEGSSAAKAEMDAARAAQQRTEEIRVKARRQQTQERREREVCAWALRLALRLWSEFPEFAESSDNVYDVVEFLKSSRGMEMSMSRPELLSEIACVMFRHQLFYTHSIQVLHAVKHTPDLRRLLFQNLVDYHERPRPPPAPPVSSGDGDEPGFPSTSTKSGSQPTPAEGDRSAQVLELLSILVDLLPSLKCRGEVEGRLLQALTKSVIQEFVLQGTDVVGARMTASRQKQQLKKQVAPQATAVSASETPVSGPLTIPGFPSKLTQGLLQGARTAVSPPETSRSIGSAASSTRGANSWNEYAVPPVDTQDVETASLHTLRLILDLCVTLVDLDPFFQRPSVMPIACLSQYFYSLPTSDVCRVEYVTELMSVINELLTLSERHSFPDSILQAMAQIFVEHPPEGRRGIAECVHMFFQILVRRDLSTLSANDAANSDAFTKRMKKLCELTGMPTIRVKVKVLDEEEAARIAAQKKAEEEERRRAAAEEAERVRRETEEREDRLAAEMGYVRRKRYERKPLYVAPEPTVRPGDFGQRSIFEYKRNVNWVRLNIVLGDLMNRVEVALGNRAYEKFVLEARGAANTSVDTSAASRPGGIPESFLQGWQKGKTYEQQQAERRAAEEAELERKEILRRLRAQDVKEKLKMEAYQSDMKKLQQLFDKERQHAAEEEADARTVIRNTYLKGTVHLYHLFREEAKRIGESTVSQTRQRHMEEQRQQEEEERRRRKEKLQKYWEEKEYFEAQLLAHRAEEASKERQREESKKQQYLEDQKRRLMTWRLQNQYSSSGVAPEDAATASSDTSSQLPPGRQPTTTNPTAVNKKKSAAAAGPAKGGVTTTSPKDRSPVKHAGSVGRSVKLPPPVAAARSSGSTSEAPPPSTQNNNSMERAEIGNISDQKGEESFLQAVVHAVTDAVAGSDHDDEVPPLALSPIPAEASSVAVDD